jgi:pimeloyl-ACP methyl ester carboxylesterase
MNLHHYKGYILICILCGLLACTGITGRSDIAENIAHQSGFTKKLVNTGQFILTTYSKSSGKNAEILNIYIEGDGYAFQRKNRISSDPTPKTPVALELAVRDPNASVLYIARPCQYLTRDLLNECDPKYWSTHRYAEEVITAINDVINQNMFSYKKTGLVGYSGGGSIAVLLAARRQDIAWLVTIGANLDLGFWTTLHDVTPLSGSLNPAYYAASIQKLPQLHLIGEKDKIVPASVSRAYLDKVVDKENIRFKTISGFDHQCCWADIWPQPLCDLDSFYCSK